MAASVERGGLGPRSLRPRVRGAGFLAVWRVFGVSYGPTALLGGGEKEGGGVRRDPLSKKKKKSHCLTASRPRTNAT
jgi:hypothetical protein